MEQLNKVQLRGLVGNVTAQAFNGRQMIRFSVATNRAYRDAMGVAKIDTTWHNVTGWEGRGIPDSKMIHVGEKVEVLGRIRNTKFLGSDGQEHFNSEIQARKITILPDDELLSDEM